MSGRLGRKLSMAGNAARGQRRTSLGCRLFIIEVGVVVLPQMVAHCPHPSAWVRHPRVIGADMGAAVGAACQNHVTSPFPFP